MSRSGGGEKKVFTMTKIDIVSGFLGAGKTTLIKKLLAEAFQGEKLVLIENEFGEISIDGGFLKDSGVQISEMSSGCICCSLVGDFNKALKDVYKRQRLCLSRWYSFSICLGYRLCGRPTRGSRIRSPTAGF